MRKIIGILKCSQICRFRRQHRILLPPDSHDLRLTLIKEIAGYFRVFKKYLGNRLYIVFLLTALAVVAEAFGIALLLPLLELMESGSVDDTSRITQVLTGILNTLGIGDSKVGILVFIAFVFLVKGGIKFVEGSYKAVLSANLLREMKAKLFGFYSGMTYSHYTDRSTGHFINIISEQLNKLLHAFEAYKRFLSEIIITLVYLLFAFLVSWQFALMATVAGCFILLLFRSLNRYAKNLSRKTSDEYTSLHSLLVQTLQSFPYIAATAQFGHLRDQVMGSIYRLTGYYRNQQIAQSFTTALREPVSVLLILAIVILQITVFDTRIAPILVSLVLIYRAVKHIIAIQGSWQQTMNFIGGLEMVEKEFAEVEKNQETKGEHKMEPFSKKIRVENVSFSHKGRVVPTLHNITLQIEARSTTAIFGPSGSGKTTLINMLTLLHRPDSGRLIFDGISHEDINPSTWRSQIGYVPQESVIFDDSIAANICFWEGNHRKDEALLERIIEAAERANALEFIRELPNGFDTMVGDRGVRLSGGQKQRLAIARELFKQPAILILDEATSELDMASEESVRESIRSLHKSITVIIITHRVSAIQDADRIFMLENGSLARAGTYEELRASLP